MARYANQRTIISKKKAFSSGDNFIQISNEDWMSAASNIQQFNTFKLYLYFAKNQPGYKDEFSPEYVQQKLGMGKTSCEEAFKRLVDLGYLKLVAAGYYEFYTRPCEDLNATAEKKSICQKTAVAEKCTKGIQLQTDLNATAEKLEKTDNSEKSAVAEKSSVEGQLNTDLDATAEIRDIIALFDF